MNNITILGRLVKEPVIKKTERGTPYVSFSLASRQGKDKTSFIPCIAFNNIAEAMNRYLDKGHRIFAEGYVETIFGEKGNNNIVMIRYIEFADNKITLEPSEKDEEIPLDDNYEVEDPTDELPF